MLFLLLKNKGGEILKKIYLYKSSDGEIPFNTFIEKLDSKMKSKIQKGIMCMALHPTFMVEPHIKHFTIEKYSRLYEYRERIKIMVRVIFTITPNGDIILFNGFVKKHERNTMQALDTALKLLNDIDSRENSLVEYIFI